MINIGCCCEGLCCCNALEGQANIPAFDINIEPVNYIGIPVDIQMDSLSGFDTSFPSGTAFPVVVTIDWGDGSPTENTAPIALQSGAGTNLGLSHTYIGVDVGDRFTIECTYTDINGQVVVHRMAIQVDFTSNSGQISFMNIPNTVVSFSGGGSSDFDLTDCNNPIVNFRGQIAGNLPIIGTQDYDWIIDVAGDIKGQVFNLGQSILPQSGVFTFMNLQEGISMIVQTTRITAEPATSTARTFGYVNIICNP